MNITKKHKTQKYIKMSNKDINKKQNTEIYKDEKHGDQKKTQHRNI
jgi:hypothetical protein